MRTRVEEGVLRPEDVSREMGLSPTQIRNLMRHGRFNPPIGYAHKTKGRRYRYVIYRNMLDEYLHKGENPRADPGILVQAVADLREENKTLADLVRSSQEESAALRELVATLVKDRKEMTE